MKELNNFSDVTVMMIWGMNQGESNFNAFNSASGSGGDPHSSFYFILLLYMRSVSPLFPLWAQNLTTYLHLHC